MSDALPPLPAKPSSEVTVAIDPRPNRRDLAILSAVLLALLVVVTTLWRGAQSDLDAIADEEEALPEVSEVLEEVFDGTDVDVTGDDESATVVMNALDSLEASSNLEEGLDQLGFGAATMERIGGTRALDGTQEAEGDNVDVTWTYHPDDGLRLIFERQG